MNELVSELSVSMDRSERVAKPQQVTSEPRWVQVLLILGALGFLLSFLLLPLQIKGQPFALIDADQATPGGIVVDDKALGLLRTLRNQAVMAFRQAG